MGRAAEEAVATYLANRGYKVLERNWRNKFCEIDIVARRKKRIHIVEVKYRTNPDHGDGFDYITAQKCVRLRRAALYWALENEWRGDMQIDVAAVTGKRLEIEYIDSAIEDSKV